MKNFIWIMVCLFCVPSYGQVSFKTRVTQKPIVVGTSFRVEYVAESVISMEQFTSPSFPSFKVVYGPEVYSGPPSVTQTRNTTYTLEALRPGKFKIAGAEAVINGKNIKSNDAWVEIITVEQSEQQRRENGAYDDNAPYFLRPGEDPYEKIRQNLFVRVKLNKKDCTAGEAIVATFKLYSRLESKSEIAKNPGFYGFTVHDMIGLTDKFMTSETVNGRQYDVHTIRQVQLYPLQSGQYVVDPMEINNKVEFSRSFVSKKTEQEITEGLSQGDESLPQPGTEIFETSIKTESVIVNVKPSPAKNKPANFNGATGFFEISSGIEKSTLAKNEEGYLVVIIKGRGNFSQLNAPTIQWPSGIEGFEPTVEESIDKSVAPLTGTKTFRYPFTSSKPGAYTFSTISLAFFSPDSNKYRIVSTTAEKVTITNEEKKTTIVPTTFRRSISEVNRKASKVAAGIVVVLVLVVLLYWLMKKKEAVKNIPVVEEVPVQVAPSVEEILQPIRLQMESPDKEFYSSLYRLIWNQVALQFNLSGTELNKYMLNSKLDTMAYEGKEELLLVLQQCETGMFTNALLDYNREELLARVQILLEKLRR